MSRRDRSKRSVTAAPTSGQVHNLLAPTIAPQQAAHSAGSDNQRAEPNTSSWRLYLILAVSITACFSFEIWLTGRPLFLPQPKDLSEFDKRQIDIFVEQNKLLTSLATALIAATTGFVLNRDKKPLYKGDMRQAIASWALAALSIYFGNLAYGQLLWMLNKQIFDILYDAILFPSRIQFWSFLLSAVFLANFIYRTLQRDTDATSQ